MKFALYQAGKPLEIITKYGYAGMAKPSVRVSIFPADIKGLNAAIEEATRSDAQIVKIDKDYESADELMKVVKNLISKGRGIKLFMPSIGVERLVK